MKREVLTRYVCKTENLITRRALKWKSELSEWKNERTGEGRVRRRGRRQPRSKVRSKDWHQVRLP